MKNSLIHRLLVPALLLAGSAASFAWPFAENPAWSTAVPQRDTDIIPFQATPGPFLDLVTGDRVIKQIAPLSTTPGFFADPQKSTTDHPPTTFESRYNVVGDINGDGYADRPLHPGTLRGHLHTPLRRRRLSQRRGRQLQHHRLADREKLPQYLHPILRLPRPRGPGRRRRPRPDRAPR